ncbi:hypothetical protein [Anaeromyxobacter sp. Fw109-5]|uniref:hypothetical protein n=1 Tax=Anaeromyxobacter sp. (strain Fw109-5) TaxID=404589 RepID=UPI00117CCD34|nr:hypothetical protein [Anaeromyxobacter sp. Fw109-5]
MLPGVGQFGISSLLEDPITKISLAEGAAQFAVSVGLDVVVAMLIPVAGAAAPLVIPAAMIVGGLTSAVIGAVASNAKGESFSWSRAGLDFAVGAVGASVPGLMHHPRATESSSARAH